MVINPKYEYLREWVERIPFFFENDGEVIYKGRNTVKVFSLEKGICLNVKKYKRPPLYNRIVYSFFRKPKAFRAYYNTLKITEKGFESAESVAFLEIKKNGLFSDSYFVSLQCSDVKEMREYYFGPLVGNESIIDAFARYSAALHDAGIYHLDYSPGNILIRYQNGNYAFVLVDVNRMKFMPVSFEAGCRNFARLFGNDDIYRRIATIYSESRKNTLDKEETFRLIMRYRNQFLDKQRVKKKMKSRLRANRSHSSSIL